MQFQKPNKVCKNDFSSGEPQRNDTCSKRTFLLNKNDSLKIKNVRKEGNVDQTQRLGRTVSGRFG